MSLILAIETATANCAVSIVGEGVEYHQQLDAPQQHAQMILPMIEQALADTSIKPQELTALAFGEGPGAFTGLRIAAGVVQGLALGWNKPVLNISTLEGLALQGCMQTGQQQWCACLDARMGEIYMQKVRFDIEGRCIERYPAQLMSVEQALASIDVEAGIGDFSELHPQWVERFDTWIEAKPGALALAQLALQKLAHNPAEAQWLEDGFIPQPVYLRPAVTRAKVSD